MDLLQLAIHKHGFDGRSSWVLLYLTEIKDRQRDDASTIPVPSAMPRHHYSFQTHHPVIADEIYWSIHQLHYCMMAELAGRSSMASR